MKKNSLSYIGALAIATVAVCACDEDFERPPMILPTSTWEANTTIKQIKETYWSTVEGTPQVIGLNEQGDSVIIKGRVCSSDQTGNIFKTLYIQGDEESDGKAIAIVLDFYDIYETYKYGQEICVNLTGLAIGGYRGLMQIGIDNAGSVGRVPEATFALHAQGNGLPDVSKVDTVTTTIATVEAAKLTAEGTQQWQGRLVRFDGVSFEDAGQPYATGTTSTSRYITDDSGNRINVYNSTYSDFKDEPLPYGSGSVVGILSYYGSNWQVLLNGTDGCIGFNGVASPVFSPEEGTVKAGTEVTISCPTEGATIHYTVDGTQPTITSKEYTAPIVIDETTTIMAIATKDGLDASPVVTARFTVSNGEVIYSETFLEGNLGQFTTTVETSGSWTGWRANTGTPLCALANSYVSGANEAATSWLISPQIDLSGATTASISLEQAFGYYFPTAQEQFCTVNIREKGGQWQALTLTNYPAKGSGNWTSFAENSIDIASFAGKTIQIGFKYVNDGKQSIAWEIRNFSLTADAGSVIAGGDTPEDPTGTTKFKLASSITSGKSYLIVAEGKMAVQFGEKTYGYINVEDVTITNDEITADTANAFIFKATDGGYTIQEAATGRYLYMTGTYNSFNLDATLPSTGGVWTVTFSDGKAQIKNTEMGKTVQYSAQYTSYGAYATEQGSYPSLYEKVD